MSLRKQTLSGVKWTTVASFANVAGSLLRVAVLARYLEKQDFGLMALVLFVLGFTNLFADMGISSAILHKQNISKSEYHSLYWLNTFVSIGLYILVVAIAIPVGVFYDEPRLPGLLMIMGTNILIVSIGNQFRVIEQKKLHFKYLACVEVVSLILSVFASILMAINGYGVYSLIIPSLIQSAVSNLCFLVRGLKRHGLGLHFSWKESIPFLKIGSFRVGSQIINYFNKGLDTLLIGKFLGMEALGPYSIAKQFVFRPQRLINPVLTRVASPVLARFQSEPEKLRANYLKMVKAISSISIPLYASIIIFAPIVIPLIYGKSFPSLVPLVQILSAYMAFRSIGNPIGSLVVATGRTDLEFSWNFGTLLTTPVIIYYGCQYGAIGAAFALLASQALYYLPSWLFLSRPMAQISLKQYLYAATPSPLKIIQTLKSK